jgi:ribosomal protein S18 acetylase RimI-like enzyme
MWRLARPEDEPQLVAMCQELNAEDPGEAPVPPAHLEATLALLRREPIRGRAVVLELEGRPAGYALLVSFWSNELGGEVCNVDELYVRSAARRRGWAAALVQGLAAGGPLWPGRPVAIELEVSPGNERAQALYAALGFRPVHNLPLRLTPGHPTPVAISS